jgi:hypothetical protein
MIVLRAVTARIAQISLWYIAHSYARVQDDNGNHLVGSEEGEPIVEVS